MTPQQLKNSILQHAIQGKLVEQIPSEGTAEELYNQIQKEKKQLIFENKIKKEKALAPITDEEIPFAIPDNWKWMRIPEMSYFQEGPGILAKDFRDNGVPLIRISGMQTERVNLNGCNYLDPVKVAEKWSHFKLDVGDILISTSASMDKVCEVYEDTAGAIPYTGQIRFKMYGGILKEYFKYFIQSPFYANQISSMEAGAAIKHYGPTHLKKMIIPIPPVGEQKRIVKKIEQVLPLVDRYGEAWSKLEAFNQKFPEDIKKSLIMRALQGLLVPQISEEGTGDELYLEIKKERRQSCAGKKLEEVASEKKLIDIPNNWKWVYLGDIAELSGGFAFKSSNYSMDGTRVIRISDFDNNGFKNNKIVRYPFSDDLIPFVIKVNDILLCMTGGTVGKSLLVKELPEMMLANQRVATIRPIKVFPEYLFTVMQSSLVQNVIQEAKNSTNDNISMNDIKHFTVPLPPLSEQKRIVEKLNVLLKLCDKLIK